MAKLYWLSTVHVTIFFALEFFMWFDFNLVFFIVMYVISMVLIPILFKTYRKGAEADKWEGWLIISSVAVVAIYCLLEIAWWVYQLYLM